MGSKISRPSKDMIEGLKYREWANLEKPLTLPDDISKNAIQIAMVFYSKLYEVRHVSWDRGGGFFHELFDFYKRYPKLQVEFLTQTLMQLRENPHRQYELKLHWVLMEFLFHGTNHLLMNEILCDFYKDVLKRANDQIKTIENEANFERKTASNGIRRKTDEELDVLYHPYRIRATAEYTSVNLQSIIDYGSQSGCSMGGTPKWLVVELHDSRGISYHRKVIRYKLYERKARYVDTVAAEFGFSDPARSELFVVYTDARKTSYRVNYGHDMLRPDEELRFDLDWTDCYFIYKSPDTPLRNNRDEIVKIPDDNGKVFFLCELPEGECTRQMSLEQRERERTMMDKDKRRHSSVNSRHGAVGSKEGKSRIEDRNLFTDDKFQVASSNFGSSIADQVGKNASSSNKPISSDSLNSNETTSTTASGSPGLQGSPPNVTKKITEEELDRKSTGDSDFATPTAVSQEDDEETMILFRGNRIQ